MTIKQLAEFGERFSEKDWAYILSFREFWDAAEVSLQLAEKAAAKIAGYLQGENSSPI